MNLLARIGSLTASAAILLTMSTSVRAQDPSWPPEKTKSAEFSGRKLDTFQHGIQKDWGYAAPQRDTFLVLHPKQAKPNSPLYVVLHSAGHDVHSCLACTTKVGNHDIYHSPPEFFALYLDCRANKGDWWWGSEKYKGPEVCPTEKRVVDTVKWVIKEYGIDENRVYLCGNSMGGSGALGIGMRHGDVFAAIKANVPAKVEHVSSRMYFPPKSVPANVTLPDPPIVIDYSAQNDGWSKGHDTFVEAMNERKYPLFLYWGPFEQPREHSESQRPRQLVRLAERQEERVLPRVHQGFNQRPFALAGSDRRQKGGPGQRVLPLEERERHGGLGRDATVPYEGVGPEDVVHHPGGSDRGREFAPAPEVACCSRCDRTLDVRPGPG